MNLKLNIVLNNSRRFSGLILLVCFQFMLDATNLLAQSTITFLSSDTYQPIEKVAVYNKSKTFSTVSNEKGICTINKDIKDGEILYIQHISFLNEEIPAKELRSKKEYLLIPESVELEELIIAVSKSEERLEEISNKIDIIKASDLKLSNPQTSADLLTQTGNVYIQKSQMGGGSPVIRGFEANKVLIAVDGIKLNNAIYRGGHLQNVITIDPSIIERTEVVYGPGSLIYGSDAIGGVMHFVTKTPKFSKNENFKFNGNATIRTSTANKEKTAHLDFSSGFGKLAFLSSISYSNFGDLKIGGNRKAEEGEWGQLPYMVSSANGYDENIENPDPDVLSSTGYSQLDILQKIVFKANEQNTWLANLQYSTSSEIPRFDKLNDIITTNGLTRPQPKWSKWSYGPQNRLLTSLQHRFAANKHNLFNSLSTTLAYQKIDEDRLKRKFNSAQTVVNEEDVHVLSLNMDAQKALTDKHNIQYGIELTHNQVGSDAYTLEEEQRQYDYVLTRYPDEGSSMSTASVYVRHKLKQSKKLHISDGLRYSFNRLTANFSDAVNIPEKTFKGNFNALTGAFGLTYLLTSHTRLLSNVGTGFRAPNIDDSGKFFDPQDGIVVVPNFNIKPEYIINADIGVRHKIAEVAQLKVDVFYNYLYNAIVRRPTSLNNSDSLLFDGIKAKVFSNQNAGRAIVYGLSAGLNLNFGKLFSGYFNHNYTRGKDMTEQVPLGHIPPQFGEAGLKFKHSKIDIALFIKYNGTKPEDLYSPFGEDKESEALNELYTPGWQTFNFKFNTKLNDYISISGGVENIFDQHYKPFASGISGPGKNFILALRSSF